jgi:pimeloyl-ACP methyl ester carboxylesterase
MHVKAQDISGGWIGVLAVGGANLHLVFNIKKTADTSYSSTLDSPDQKVFGMPCAKTWLLKDSLFISVKNIVYKGLWNEKDGITGTFKQGSFTAPLNLTPLIPPVRPQTPKPPYGYYTEDVEYDNADKSLHYGATFTRPNGDGKYPAVIIITGSGTQDRDGTLFGHKLYWVLADYLTKNGIAVLRVDDRGAGKSTTGKNMAKATSLDFSYDVETSLNYLETRADVDKKHLGLIGHSEGGIIAPMVAARRKDVSFIVMWGAPEIGGARINTEQNVYFLKKSGIDSVAVNAFKTLHLQILALFASSPSKEILDQKIAPVFDAWKKAQSPATLKALNVQDHSIVGQDVFAMYHSLYNIPWMRFFMTYRPETDLMKVKCAVLAINGAKDTQVEPKSNLSLIREILTKSGNKNFEIAEVPNLNHLLQTAVTGDDSEYEKITETLSPVALNIISTFIKLHTE